VGQREGGNLDALFHFIIFWFEAQNAETKKERGM
jgi:hypothetical protein